MEPIRTEWQVRCAFNSFCKRVLKHEAINAYNQRRQQQAHEMTFSDLTPQEENQLCFLVTVPPRSDLKFVECK
ncbi:hypothetical protein [Niallia sp. 01092]|uniref:hypothetical protein n=1 Tax=unclassified Niallia TaxID=2837522 RepID=UPI003FD379AA